MRHIPFTIAALIIAAAAAACSTDEREASLITEAQASAPKVNDHGWRPGADYSPPESEPVREYY